MNGSKDLTAALDELMKRSRNGQDNSLPDANPRGDVPAQRSSSLDSPGSGSGKNNKGINSPLTETDYAERQWFPERTLTTTDGVFAVRVRALKKIFMTDAKDNSVEMVFKDQP
ncbi:hypothetical protein [Quatrionicoccus australiensis]|uniref:hypothetical protein n=1 Tax=Quatrionicoccus australiensis TaxID=138118 RepID=UPI001CF8630D|nr:hypothetical protein [Quatrionicoccus australiensis]UCV13758.1 hypothetical protein KI612_12415 [Quatrionicoccus australiensis]